MFGQFYQQRDDEVAGRTGFRPATPGEYAKDLLADLLNRTEGLEVAFIRCYETAEDPAECRGAAEALVRVVGQFLEDVEEAKTRGLRARCFCRGSTGSLDGNSIAPKDSLEDLGGELVSADRAGE
jgi:hypothetical protein